MKKRIRIDGNFVKDYNDDEEEKDKGSTVKKQILFPKAKKEGKEGRIRNE